MKCILHVMNSLLPSGAETMLKVSADAWEGCEKHIVATYENLGEYAYELHRAGYIIHHLYCPNLKEQGNLLKNLIQQIHPDVVHIHCDDRCWEFARIAKQAGVEHIVRTVHNCFRHTRRQRIRKIVERFKCRAIGVKFVAIGESVYLNEIKRFYNRCDHTITNWCDETKYQFISDDDRGMFRKQYSWPKSDFIFVSVGNCSRIKNHDYVILALSKLVHIDGAGRNGTPAVIYYHIGAGSNEDHEKRLAVDLGVEENIRFVGRDDPMKYLPGCNLFVMPSIYEGLGISALEAILCGIPVLLTDVSGLRDFKQVGADEIVFTELNEDAYYRGLKELYNRFVRGKLHNSMQLRYRTLEYHNMKKSVSEYMRVYEE